MNTATIIISILSLLALWIWFRHYSETLYKKGRNDEHKWQTENNIEARQLMAGAVNRGYAEWKMYDTYTGKTEFKWIEPGDYKIRQIDKNRS